jgi:putative transferase (TIGR04331 family)
MNWGKTKVSIALSEVFSVREQLLMELKRLLDEYTKWNLEARYYDIIAGDWMDQFAHLTYASMVAALEDNSRDGLGKFVPVTADPLAYHVLSLKRSGLHERLKDSVCALLAGETPTNWQFSADSLLIESRRKTRLTQALQSILHTKHPEVLLVSPYFKCGTGEVLNTLLAWRKWACMNNLTYPLGYEKKLNVKWRLGRACEVGQPTDFLGVLKVLLPLHLPVALLEGLITYRDAVLGMPVERPRIVYSANALYANLTFKLLAVEWMQEGTKLFYHQHGGGYGLDKMHSLERYESGVSDRFFTWGWNDTEDPKMRSLSVGLPTLKARTKRYLLLNCVDFPDVFYRLQFHPMPGSIEGMRRETCDFVATLPDHRDLMVRPYAKDYSGNFVGTMRQIAPTAEFDSLKTGPFQRYSQSRLVVHNYLGTAYLETLALNVPTVCFYDPAIYAFRHEAMPFIDALERVGILHRSGKAAAVFVATHSNDSEGWWQLPDVQEARCRFIERYANFSPDWKHHWEREFQQAIDDFSA